jgi:hypothetical protein
VPRLVGGVTRRGWSVTLAAMVAVAIGMFVLPVRAERFRKPAPVRAEPRVSAQE